jgi:hypothetical protein
MNTSSVQFVSSLSNSLLSAWSAKRYFVCSVLNNGLQQAQCVRRVESLSTGKKFTDSLWAFCCKLVLNVHMMHRFCPTPISSDTYTTTRSVSYAQCLIVRWACSGDKALKVILKMIVYSWKYAVQGVTGSSYGEKKINTTVTRKLS